MNTGLAFRFTEFRYRGIYAALCSFRYRGIFAALRFASSFDLRGVYPAVSGTTISPSLTSGQLRRAKRGVGWLGPTPVKAVFCIFSNLPGLFINSLLPGRQVQEIPNGDRDISQLVSRIFKIKVIQFYY